MGIGVYDSIGIVFKKFNNGTLKLSCSCTRLDVTRNGAWKSKKKKKMKLYSYVSKENLRGITEFSLNLEKQIKLPQIN